jgi:hypothetical protein
MCLDATQLLNHAKAMLQHTQQAALRKDVREGVSKRECAFTSKFGQASPY